ncbi:DUF4832 domain-containing protein [Ferruginibacter paludis]|uniref:DUF4832 domain-containing protein n=1 Tax=Ferruginibacter paludis TaxID=1310417 RepID=UPI0025B39592|nr:DUF4832 domain-containing protein [Ferruginibacter paludis]MDN3657927.1 DUF4832 domain-containing protein [Ferruginibacter paludis]
MKKKNWYRIFFSGVVLCCLLSCKKSKTTPPPVVDNTITYDISAAIFPNPERGFMHNMDVHSEGTPLSTTLLASMRAQNVSMVLRFFYLEAFKDKAISAVELGLIQGDLDKIRVAGLKAILRFAYTDSIGGADAPYAIIAQHIDQLKPIFEANKDVIAFVQAGFIGAWGEWHSSTNGLATADNERQVLNKLLSVLPQDIMVQVRTPTAKQQIFNSNLPVTADIAYTSEGRARVGHHNDCFLTGGTNYGTYTNVTAEKQYISDDALYVPTGGETCPPENGYDPTCNEGRNEMKLLRWTYLNLDWYPATINEWKNSGCFDEFHTYLGYRLALVSAKFPDQVTANGTLAVAISIINKGYAPLYNKKNTYLVLKDKTSGTLYEVALAADLRTCKPAATLAVSETPALTGIPAGTYDMYLRISDNAANLKPRIEYAVRLANTDTWVEENGGMNNLKHQLIIK